MSIIFLTFNARINSVVTRQHLQST